MMEGAGSSAQALDLGENITHLQRLSFLHWPDGGALSPVLADVVEVAIAISNADSASIQIVDRETSSLRVAAQRGLPDGWLDDAHALASGRGTWALALERGHRIVIEDVEASPYFADTEALENQRRAGVRAVQSTPLLSRSGRGVGVLSTHYRTPFRPDAFVLALLDLLARQAADVIDRALLDQERRELERKYMALFHTSPIAIALTRMPDAVLADVNEAFLQLFESTRADVVGRPGVDLGFVEPDLAARVRSLLQTEGVVRGLECTRVTRSGDRQVLALYITRVDIGWGRYVLTKVVDVTARREGEEEARRSAARLAEVNRELELRVAERTRALEEARRAADAALAAKSELLSSVGHELRTPLNAILGFAQLLLRDQKRPLDERQSARLEHVIRGGEHLLRLINDLLDLSKIESGELAVRLEPVSVHGVIAEAIATLAPMAAKTDISLVRAEDLREVPRVTADRARLTQILIHFGSNAIKYGRPGGRAVFGARRVGDDEVRITVLDDGIGIAPDHVDEVFEPFQRAGHENGPIDGTGVGLAVTKRLAERMAGRVGVSSTLDRGSEFWVELPAASQVVSPSIDLEVDLAAGSRRSTIVCIDDNPANVALLAALVEDLGGLELVVAPSADIGLELIRSHRPSLVVIDVQLPGMSGFEALRRLRSAAETRAIPVIGLASEASRWDKRRAARAGFARYLAKPLRVDDLVRAMEELLGRDDTPPMSR